MFKENKKLNNIQSYTTKHNLCIQEGCIYSINENKVINDTPNQREIFSFGNEFIISKDVRGNSFLLNIKSKLIKKAEKINSFYYPYIQYYTKESPRKYRIYNHSINETLFETTDWIGRDIINDYIFSDYQGIITCRSVFFPDPKWQFTLTQLASTYKKQNRNEEDPYKVSKFIGVLDNKLWVALNHYTVISLCIETGKLTHQLSQIPNFDYPFGDIIPAPESMLIDNKRNLLISLAWEYYWEINPKTGKIIMYNLLDYFSKLKLRNDFILNIYFNEEEGHLFFGGKKSGNQNDSQIACLDVNTKKIIWQFKFQPDKNGIYPQLRDLQGSSTKLGVLDNNSTLHVFEKLIKEQLY